MSLPIHITSIGAVIVAAIATYTDVRTGKIYNKLTFPAAAVGIIARAAEYGMMNPDTMLASAGGGALNGILGCLTGMIVIALMKSFLPHLGHGDTKLFGALGAFVGPNLIFGTFVYFCLIYAVFSIGWMASAFPWNQYFAVTDKSLIDMTKFNEVRKKVIPIAPFIAAGLLVAVIFEPQTVQFFSFGK